MIKDKKDFALKILKAMNIREDKELGYLLSLNNHYNYYQLTAKNIDTLINEILSEVHIEWFDETKQDGHITIDNHEIYFKLGGLWWINHF